MKTLITLAWRNIWRNKRRSFISIASVLFAVLFAISADSFERGSYESMIQNMVKFSTGYIQIQDVMYEDEPSIDNLMLYDEELISVLNNFETEIEYSVPRLQNFALASANKSTRGCMVIGIHPESENKFNRLSENVVEGSFIDENDDSVVLAEGLADILGLTVGDTLILLGQGFQGVSAAGLYPVKGIVKMSIPEMNNNAVYMSLSTAQWFYGADDRITSLIIMPRNPKRTQRLADNLNNLLDSEWYVALTWDYLLKDFLRMMEIDAAGSKMIIFILYVVIGFGIFGTILTMMLERMKEFAMLISIGMRRLQLGFICVLESVIMSFTGVVLGIVITLPIILYFYYNPIQLTGEMALMMEDYGFEAIIPASASPDIFISQAVAIFIIAFLIGLYPLVKIYKMKVTETVK